MNKNNRLEIAQETIKIIENGYYFVNENKIDVSKEIKYNIDNTFTISPNDWTDIVTKSINENDIQSVIEVKNCSSIEAIVSESFLKVGVLNFASAKNPGGGFLGGASAQEESLARSSSLYSSLIKDKTMYDFNRENSTFLYSDYMIFSPNTVFWFDDNGTTLQNFVTVDVITAPAPNKGAMMQHNRDYEIKKIETEFLKRIDYVLHLANQQSIECLILGAWGCGVFRNEPADVAKLFKKVIDKKYSKAFKKIVFAVYDTSEKKQTYNAFVEKLELGKDLETQL